MELILGYRLTVGRQILVLNVGVRIPVPEPIPHCEWATPYGFFKFFVTDF